MKQLLTNCPNCGAPLSSDGYCEYCGTKARYANEVEFNTFLYHGSIADVMPTEMLFKFKGANGEVIVIPFVGKPENITIEYDSYNAVDYAGHTLYRINRTPTVRFEMAGSISPIKEGI